MPKKYDSNIFYDDFDQETNDHFANDGSFETIYLIKMMDHICKHLAPTKGVCRKCKSLSTYSLAGGKSICKRCSHIW